MERETIRKWANAAFDSGDCETYMIALKTLGKTVTPGQEWHLPMRRQRQIARMTERGAQRLVAKWEKRKES